MVFQANGSRKQAGIAILISNKVDFQPKLIKRDGKGHFILTKWKIHQEDLFRTVTFVKETSVKLKSHIKPPTLILGVFNTSFLPIDRQKLKIEIMDLTDVIK